MADRPTFPITTRRNVRIPMPDGVTLAADLYLPAGAGEGTSPARFPAIIEYTPYHKNNNAFYGPRASRYPYFASHGYVFVNVDIRGLGDSGGCNTSPSSPEEIRDNLDMIRWCAQQPWCDGQVGMIGISYTAGVCYDAARQAPPELKAVVLCQMMSDWYGAMACPGGTPRPFAYENYAPLMAAYNFAPPNPDLVGPDWTKLWQERLDNSVPWGNAYLENLLDGPFWDSRLLRGREEQVTAATFLIGGWCDWYPDDFLKVFSRLRCPKRVLIGPWTHNYPENAWPLPRINDRFECLRWFDKHMKGLDTDPARPLESEPPITLFVEEFNPPAPLRREDAGYFQHETEWPPSRVHQRSVYFVGHAASVPVADAASVGRRDIAPPSAPSNANAPAPHPHTETSPGTLAACPTADATTSLTYRPDVGIAAGRYVIGQMLPGWGMPDDQRLDEGLSLVFTGDPFTADEPRELIGVPVARLWLSSTAAQAMLSVKLCDVAPDGTSILINKGSLNLTHLESHEKPRPLVPGRIYEVELPLLAMAHHFAPGHRLRIMLAAADFQNAWPTPLPHVLTLHHGHEHPSRIDLPFTTPHAAPLPTPQFRPSDFPPLPPDQIPTPQYNVTRDLIKNAVTVDIRTQSGVGINRSKYTVHVNRPAEAVVHSEYEYPLDRPGLSIRVHAHCVTRSDEQSFCHLTDINITINGAPHWRKSWSVSVPRPL